jgi:hypothetical protein
MLAIPLTHPQTLLDLRRIYMHAIFTPRSFRGLYIHTYMPYPPTDGPSVYAQNYFGEPDFPNNMPQVWEKHFGYVRWEQDPNRITRIYQQDHSRITAVRSVLMSRDSRASAAHIT